jgi:hypothetical protein
MSFQAYLDTIEAKTGKTPQDFTLLAEQKGFLEPGVKAGEIVAGLKEDFGLGHGHAMAIVMVLKQVNSPRPGAGAKISPLFRGDRSGWRKTYDELLGQVNKFGSDVTVSPTDSYISILRKGKKFAIVQVMTGRLDLGIKLRGIPSGGRLEPDGTWNGMVTHRVRIDDPKQIDATVISWLHQAYEKA